MTNAFERHGLDHLSASSINLFVAQPAMWAMQKLLGHKSRVGAAAHRGTAVEAGVEMGLFDPALPLEACQEAALARFNQLTALSADPNVEKERAGIASAVAIALGELRQYGIPGSADGTRQHRIEVELPGVPVPFIGWLDFWYPDHGIIIDLKTQGRLSSKISDPHARRGAIYHAAHGNNEIRFAYVTPQKIGVYRLEDPRTHIARVVSIARSIERFLGLSDDGAEPVHDPELIDRIRKEATAAMMVLRDADRDMPAGTGRGPSLLVHSLVCYDVDAALWSAADLKWLGHGLDALTKLYRIRLDSS